jgi:hypothetical protein
MDKLMIYLIDNINYFYKNYTLKLITTTQLLTDPEFSNLCKIIIYLVNTVTIIAYYINPIYKDYFRDKLVLNIGSNIDSLYSTLIISIGIYFFLLIFSYIVSYCFYENKQVDNMIYSKSIILLIHPNDIKDVKPVIEYLKREMRNITNT